MTDDPKAKKILQDFAKMQGERTTYESAWRDIRCYVRPNAVDFNASNSPGDIRTIQMFDSTAMQANTDLAGEVFADLFNPSERGWGISVSGNQELNRDPDIIEWCDYVAETINAAYGDERTQLTSAAHEIIQDITSFGNGIISQEWNEDTWQLQFMARPLAQSFFATDINGIVNRLFRCEKLRWDQIKARWKDVAFEGSDKIAWDKEFEVIHAVHPRDWNDREYGRTDSRNMPFASCWCLKEKCIMLEEGGYSSFPYHTPRWNKVADETYGRGPAINCLPSIKMLNKMKLTALKAASKAVDPSVWLPNEGVRLPYKDEPGAINFYDPSEFPGGFQPISTEHKGNFPVTEQMMEMERQDIRKAFYTDWQEWFPKPERQSAYEVSQLTQRKMAKMAPLLGRLQTELLVPMVQRSYELLSRAALIPQAPPQLDGRKLRVVYVSASARAQAASEASSLMLFFQQVLPLAQADPTVMDAINMPAALQELAYKQKISRRIIRSDEEVAAREEQRQQKEQMMQMAGAAEPISKAVLNVAKAQEAGGLAAA